MDVVATHLTARWPMTIVKTVQGICFPHFACTPSLTTPHVTSELARSCINPSRSLRTFQRKKTEGSAPKRCGREERVDGGRRGNTSASGMERNSNAITLRWSAYASCSSALRTRPIKKDATHGRAGQVRRLFKQSIHVVHLAERYWRGPETTGGGSTKAVTNSWPKFFPLCTNPTRSSRFPRRAARRWYKAGSKLQ